MCLSNLRIFFRAEAGYATIGFPSIIMYQALTNGLKLTADKIGPVQLITGNPTLGILFLRLLKGEPITAGIN
ncbi:MAG: hypothetical protein DLM50_03895 [Candidatus Meridianibacter frigidus]|nr:MAG: hypothetical protein DLM50_03895 [Candidatus Eremiobacteraeota bacterium]